MIKKRQIEHESHLHESMYKLQPTGKYFALLHDKIHRQLLKCRIPFPEFYGSHIYLFCALRNKINLEKILIIMKTLKCSPIPDIKTTQQTNRDY